MLGYKLLAMAAIFLTGVAGGWLSRCMGRSEADGASNTLFLSLGNAFSGGVFLGAGLLHMLPDAN